MDDSPRSSASSTSSPSPPPSAEASVHHYEPPNLERIVQHFVSSKRSLSSANVVWRANELVTTSRGLLEELAILNAKNSFAKRGIDEQVDNLHAIREAITDSGAKAGDDFRTTIDKLDLANERLEKTLNDLRNTKVDSALSKHSLSQLNGGQSEDDDEDVDNSYEHSDGTEKNLYFYIDETRHEGLRTSLRSLIDSFNDARESLDSSMRYHDDSLVTIRNTLSSASRPDSDELADKATIYDEPPLSIPQLFHSMESHASEMAALLQSLVSHYDLCVAALRHTEGGGAAAKQALQNEHLSKDTTGVEESLYSAKTPAPMDEGERAALLNVLENDALEVVDVVDELKDHAASIERSFDQLSRQTRAARACNTGIKDALTMLHDMRDIKLPSHMDALATFREVWQSIQDGDFGQDGGDCCVVRFQ